MNKYIDGIISGVFLCFGISVVTSEQYIYGTLLTVTALALIVVKSIAHTKTDIE